MKQPDFKRIRTGLQKILSEIDEAAKQHGKHTKLDALRVDTQKNLSDLDENERTWQALEKSIDAEREKKRAVMEQEARINVDHLLDIAEASGADKELQTALVFQQLSSKMSVKDFKQFVKDEVAIHRKNTPTSQRLEDGIPSTSDNIDALQAQLKDTRDPVKKKELASKISKLRDAR